MLVLALVTLIRHESMRLHVCHTFIALKPIMCMKRVFSAKQRVLAHLTTFLLENTFKRKEMFVLALIGLTWHNPIRLHVSL